jgi:hypothetical protein
VDGRAIRAVWPGAIVVASTTLAVVAALLLRRWGVEGDVERFVEIARTSGIADVVRPTEYAPLETLLIRTVLDADVAEAATRVSLLSIASFLAIVLLLRRRWGWATAGTYAAITLPLQVFMPYRLDNVPALLAVCAALAFARNRTVSGVLLGAGAGFKLWPAGLAPSLFARTTRAWVAFLVSLGLILVVWFAVGGSPALRHVVTFRGADGWQVESTVGIVTWLATPDDHRVEAGAVRVGSISDWQRVVLASALATAIVVVATRSSRTSLDPAGVPSVVIVATLLVLAPVASPQYLAWLTPWVAIASSSLRSRSLLWLCATAGVAASLSFAVYWDVYGGVEHLQFVALLRAACTVAIAVLAWHRLLVEPRSDVEDDRRLART